ncbi:hypothetical protein J2858_001702 [Neorhizobium galegae]|uniref:hypothetical protein n=1 Tax=Neorhizobium galegae TaxID=399 RepID=UPI001AE9582F|nr:hypothetical protein [Neorhizobium galegae]MBP2548786.1 hypothetical protein [Neorhizobium galegae]
MQQIQGLCRQSSSLRLHLTEKKKKVTTDQSGAARGIKAGRLEAFAPLARPFRHACALKASRYWRTRLPFQRRTAAKSDSLSSTLCEARAPRVDPALNLSLILCPFNRTLLHPLSFRAADVAIQLISWSI